MGESRYAPGVSIECPECKRWTTGREGIIRCRGCGRLWSIVVTLASSGYRVGVEAFA